MYKNILTLFLLFLFYSFAFVAHAAILYAEPVKNSVSINENFVVNIKIDTEKDNINAAQTILTFPTDILEIVSISKEGSVFNFWVEEPSYSNSEGSATFIGGTPQGISGGALKILAITFKARGAGIATIGALDSIITASDGKGTNVLSTTKEGVVTVGTRVVTPDAPEPPQTPKVVELPQKIERKAVAVTFLPDAPDVRVPLYPKQGKWYNHVGEVIALWDLTDDVAQVSTRISQNKDQKAGDKGDELFTGKTFGELEEGEWYIRVQFRNNKGWGELTYYKISLDTTPPLNFSLNISEMASDNPSPVISFETQDSLSGISHSVITVDKKKPIVSTSTSLVLPPQSPGEHTLLVRTFDNAGNSTEDSLVFEIIPLPTPVIDFITSTVPQEENAYVNGRSLPDSFVDINVFDKKERAVEERSVATDSAGNWGVVLDVVLPRGEYSVTAVARDERGAVSNPTFPSSFKVKAKVIFSIGPLEFGWVDILLIIFLLVVSGLSILAWYYIMEQKKREAYKIVAMRDVEKLTGILIKDVADLEEWYRSVDIKAVNRTEAESLFSKINDNSKRMRKYLGREFTKIK